MILVYTQNGLQSYKKIFNPQTLFCKNFLRIKI